MTSVESKANLLAANALVHLRKQRGMSQRALAALAGVSQSLIAELERGKHLPSPNALSKLSQALGVESDQLVFATDDGTLR